MEYCLCIKLNDRNLLHIVSRNDLRKQHFYRDYVIVATAEDEQGAYEAAASLVQNYCDVHGSDDFSHFGKWVRGVQH